jgi:hypothetical protein
MKRVVFAFILLTGLMFLVSCQTVVTRPDGEETKGRGEVPIDWVTIGKNYPYKKLGNIRVSKIPEVRINFGAEPVRGQFGTTGDGFVYATMNPTAESTEQSELQKPLVKKYDKTGKLMWEKEYEYTSGTGYINNLVIYPDNGFLFTVQTFPRYSEGLVSYEKSLVVRCGKNGEILWEREFDDYSGNMMKQALLAENEEIYIIGTGRMKNALQTKEEAADSISITKLDSGGNLLEQKWFGGSDFEQLYSAVYSREAGLILWGSSQSHGGDFAIDNGLLHNDFITCISNMLEVQWVVHAGNNRGYNTAPYVTQNGEIYILGNIQETGSIPKGLLIKLDPQGNSLWEKQIYDGYWGRSLTQAENGDILIAKGYAESGMIAVVDSDGNEKKLLEGLPFNPEQICPVETGGFIVTATRIVNYVPQPPFISMIWYDTELVAVKYGNDYEIEWRKTYDKYKDQKGTDSAWPQLDGSIAVPR